MGLLEQILEEIKRTNSLLEEILEILKREEDEPSTAWEVDKTTSEWEEGETDYWEAD